MVKAITEYFPDGVSAEFKFNSKGQLLQELSDGIHKPYFAHVFDEYLP